MRVKINLKGEVSEAEATNFIKDIEDMVVGYGLNGRYTMKVMH